MFFCCLLLVGQFFIQVHNLQSNTHTHVQCYNFSIHEMMYKLFIVLIVYCVYMCTVFSSCFFPSLEFTAIVLVHNHVLYDPSFLNNIISIQCLCLLLFCCFVQGSQLNFKYPTMNDCLYMCVFIQTLESTSSSSSSSVLEYMCICTRVWTMVIIYIKCFFCSTQTQHDVMLYYKYCTVHRGM